MHWMDVIDHLTTNIPHPKDITCNLHASMEIMTKTKEREIVVGKYPKTTSWFYVHGGFSS